MAQQGRPLDAVLVARILHLAAQGVGIRATARLLHIDRLTVRRYRLRGGRPRAVRKAA